MTVGSQNVRTVYARWAHLPDRSFRLLIFMALVTMDDDTEMLFWGGRETMALSLGRIVAEKPARDDLSARADADRRTRAADFQAVKESLSRLIKAGVVTVQKAESPGRPAVYKLILDAPGGKARGRADLLDGVGETYPNRADGVGETYSGLADLGGVGGETLNKGTTNKDTTKTKPTSPLAGTSPAKSAEESEEFESAYSAAQKKLAALPNLGTDLIAKVDQTIIGYKARVIAAAEMLREEAS